MPFEVAHWQFVMMVPLAEFQDARSLRMIATKWGWGDVAKRQK